MEKNEFEKGTIEVLGYTLCNDFDDGEVRVGKHAIAEKLESNPRVVQDSINRLVAEDPNGFGVVRERSRRVQMPGGHYREDSEAYLTEAQTLDVIMDIRTPRARAIRREVIQVFLAYRRGQLGTGIDMQKLAEVFAATTALAVKPIHERLDRIEQRLDEHTDAIMFTAETTLGVESSVKLLPDAKAQGGIVKGVIRKALEEKQFVLTKSVWKLAKVKRPTRGASATLHALLLAAGIPHEVEEGHYRWQKPAVLRWLEDGGRTEMLNIKKEKEQKDLSVN